ncbi:zf-HC2 domain-containing protein [Radiobacillus sp. PE A8.2]|uniref:zf-HC2 domain-containing protein n=1 Tax=Radiobacillus sp. PE A8.2 TaxID=3380349 RepID=UPI0038911224
MEHVSKEQLARFVEGELPDAENKLVETHLDDCDICFQLYVSAIDDWSMPEIGLSETFTSETVAKITNQNACYHAKSSNPPASKARKKQTFAHYLLAAGLTVVLMLTGAFQNVLTISDQTSVKDEVSITDQLMNTTTSWLDQLKGEINR